MAGLTSSSHEKDRPTQVPKLILPKLITEDIKCLFFGKRALVLPLKFKTAGVPSVASYRLRSFENGTHTTELAIIEDELDIEPTENTVQHLRNGVYVHVYGPNTMTCSSLTLSTACTFFEFLGNVQQSLPSSGYTVDIKPFVYVEDDLQALSGSESGQLQQVPWDWNEVMWTRKLFQCIERGSLGIKVIPAFMWTTHDYETQINTIFPHICCIRAAPFHGMTDLLLFGDSSVVGVFTVAEESAICCIEMGIAKVATCPISIALTRKVWPEKTGELLASMYFFGTLNYLNRLESIPEQISWTAYGVLAIRSLGCMILKMTLDAAGCRVALVHEGGILSLGPAIHYIANCVKT